MSDESREPVGDHADEAETIEFDAIESDPDSERIEFELVLTPSDEGGASVEIKPDFKHPIELRFGRTSETSPCLLVHGSECPQLGAEYVLIQPDVIAKDPRKGWEPIGGGGPLNRFGKAYIGRGEETPQLRLGPDVSRRHVEITYVPHRNVIEVETFQDEDRRYVRVSAHPDDLVELPAGMRVVR